MEIYLNLVAETLIPDDITKILGGPPHESGKKGDPIFATLSRGRTVARPATSGYWQRMIIAEEENISEESMSELFNGLSMANQIWKSITSNYDGNITVHEAGPNRSDKKLFPPKWLMIFKDFGLKLYINED